MRQQQVFEAEAMRDEIARALDKVVGELWHVGPGLVLSAAAAVFAARAQRLVAEQPDREAEVQSLVDGLRVIIQARRNAH